jgi:hypothetical protein
VVGVQDEQLLQRVDGGGAHLVVLRRHREHHREEVLDEVERVVGVQERLTDRLLVAVRRDGRQLGHEPDDRELHLLGILRVVAVLVEGREGGDDRGEDRHRLRVRREAVEEALHVLVQERVLADGEAELVALADRGQLAVDEEVRRFEERRLFVIGELLDRVAAIAEDAEVAVDVRDRRLRGTGVHVAVVEGDQAGLAAELRDVDGPFVLGAGDDRELGLRASVAQDCRRFGHGPAPLVRGSHCRIYRLGSQVSAS